MELLAAPAQVDADRGASSRTGHDPVAVPIGVSTESGRGGNRRLAAVPSSRMLHGQPERCDQQQTLRDEFGHRQGPPQVPTLDRRRPRHSTPRAAGGCGGWGRAAPSSTVVARGKVCQGRAVNQRMMGVLAQKRRRATSRTPRRCRRPAAHQGGHAPHAGDHGEDALAQRRR